MSRVIFIGCREMGRECLEMLAQKHKDDLIAAVTFDDSMKSMIAGFEPLDDLCKQQRIPLIKVRDINAEDVIARIRDYKPDLIIQVAWTQIFSPHLLDVPKKGAVGFHCSLLPLYQGGSPVNWGIINGERQWGMSMFYMSECVDEGELIDQMPFDISMHDTCHSVYVKATECAKIMLERHWCELLQGTALQFPQSSNEGTQVKRRKPQDGKIDWSRSALQIYNWIRALTCPYPGAFTHHNGKKLYIWRAKGVFLEGRKAVQSGCVVGNMYGCESVKDAGVAVEVDGGYILLTEVQYEGGSPIEGPEIGSLLRRGDVLG